VLQTRHSIGDEDDSRCVPDDEKVNGNTDVVMTNKPGVFAIMTNYDKAGFAIGSMQFGSNVSFQS
jgi:hypothetical protein